jgi:hypothetical protein
MWLFVYPYVKKGLQLACEIGVAKKNPSACSLKTLFITSLKSHRCRAAASFNNFFLTLLHQKEA